jgi:hypothetical protein
MNGIALHTQQHYNDTNEKTYHIKRTDAQD